LSEKTHGTLKHAEETFERTPFVVPMCDLARIVGIAAGHDFGSYQLLLVSVELHAAAPAPMQNESSEVPAQQPNEVNLPSCPSSANLSATQRGVSSFTFGGEISTVLYNYRSSSVCLLPRQPFPSQLAITGHASRWVV
jgi:hypothetical protein